MDDTGSSTGLDPARVRRIGPAAYSRSRGAPAGDADTGYRYYRAAQVEQARLVALLRQLDMPLA
ncbi:hypothetical protein ACWDRM_33290, partial [Streptomyces cellulosae]